LTAYGCKNEYLPSSPPRRSSDLEERVGGVLEQQMRLVEEEHQLRHLEVAHLGELLVQLGEHPHHEGGEQGRARGHAGQLEAGDDAAAVLGPAQQLGGVEGWPAEEDVRPRGLEGGEAAQDHTGGGGGDAADALELVLALVGGEELNQGAQVLEVQQRQPL